MEYIKHRNFLVLFIYLILCSCNSSNDYAPKPTGFHRLEFPEKKYLKLNLDCPYSFDYPVYAKMYKDSSRFSKKYWYNLAFPNFNARLHISYYPINSFSEFNILMEDSRKLAFKHTVKATSIDEGLIHIPENNVHGIFYTIEGNTASAAQFFITDSTKNYLRAALYFNESPKIDSVLPVINFIRKDLDQMIKTFKWKNP